MSSRPARPGPTPTPPPVLTLEALAAAVTSLTREVDLLRATAEPGVDLATRLDTVEHELAGTQARVESVAAVAALSQPAGTPDTSGHAYQFESVADWVDEVFVRLAARHHARWCPRWEAHLEAQARLQLLWHTWEAVHNDPANHTAHDEWMRVIFDHHTHWLLDREGPFAGCTPQHCAAAPRLPQRPTDDAHGVAPVTDLGAFRHSPTASAGGGR